MCFKVRDVNGEIVAETGCNVSLMNHQEQTVVNLIQDEAKLAYFINKPVFINELNRTTNFQEGQKFNLLCRLNDTCEPKPIVVWFKDGQPIECEKGEYKASYSPNSGECRLTADACDRSLHEGVYTCAAGIPGTFYFVAKTSSKVKVNGAENNEDSSSSDEKTELDLSRGVAPIFLQSLSDVTLEEGEDLELKCQIMGAPIPDVTCYFSKDIEDKSSIKKIKSQFVHYNYETGICKINLNGIKQTNNGFYIVKASNDAGFLTSSSRVNVKAKSVPNLNLDCECEPCFKVELEPEMRGMDGQEICLICVCSAMPEPEINWFRSTLENVDEFVPVKLTNDVKAMFDRSTGKCTLKINDAYPQDSGVYVCVGSNALGTAETRTTLIIEGKHQ